MRIIIIHIEEDYCLNEYLKRTYCAWHISYYYYLQVTIPCVFFNQEGSRNAAPECPSHVVGGRQYEWSRSPELEVDFLYSMEHHVKGSYLPLVCDLH